MGLYSQCLDDLTSASRYFISSNRFFFTIVYTGKYRMLLKQLGMLSKKLVHQAAMIGVQAGKKFEFKLFEGMVKAPVQKKLKKSFLPHP